MSSSPSSPRPNLRSQQQQSPPRTSYLDPIKPIMPPLPPCPWVLLDRYVEFIDCAGTAAPAVGKPSAEASLEEVAAALKPTPVVCDPPQVTTLSMVRRLPKCLMETIDCGTVSSTDKGLVVLYAGMYRPGDGAYESAGCYLVYDASTSSLTAIPRLVEAITTPPRPTNSIRCLGTSAGILRLRHGAAADGAYVLAELVTRLYPGLPDADLYLWSSCASNPEWRRTSARLPLPAELCGLTPFFHIDMAFAFGDSCVCWADLFAGVLICDLFAPEGPRFSFVPFPEECCSYTYKKDRLAINAHEFRSMGCVCGAIKFVALVGYPEGLPITEVALKTWTLSSDFKNWMEGPCLLVRDLCRGETFRRLQLPQRGRPINPILSMNEDGIIFLSICDMEFVESYDSYGQYTGRQLKLYGHYVLRLDLMRNEVVYSKKSNTNSLSLLTPTVLASDFSSYLKDS